MNSSRKIFEAVTEAIRETILQNGATATVTTDQGVFELPIMGIKQFQRGKQ